MENLATYQVRNSVLLQRKLTETKRLFMEGALLHTRKILRKMLHAENIKYMYNKGEKQRERERSHYQQLPIASEILGLLHHFLPGEYKRYSFSGLHKVRMEIS